MNQGSDIGKSHGMPSAETKAAAQAAEGPARQRLAAAVAGVALVLGCTMAVAAPVQLTRAQFTLQTAGLSTVVENFEGFSIGNQPNPMTLANGSYTSPFPFVADILVFCNSGTNCLVDQLTANQPRTFSMFPAGTSYWASDFYAIASNDEFSVTVVGVSGTTVFTGSGAADFWSFNDAAGLLSVSFRNLGNLGGTGNYSFDNVTTAAAGAVPEPASWALVGLALAAMGSTRRMAGRRRPS